MVCLSFARAYPFRLLIVCKLGDIVSKHPNFYFDVRPINQ